MAKAFDERLLLRAERFSHWWQRMTGLTNFWLARLCSWLFALHVPALLVIIVINPWGEAPRTLFWLAALYAFASLQGLLFHQHTSKLYRIMEDYYLSSNGVAHSLTMIWRGSWRSRTISIVLDLCWILFFSAIVAARNSGSLLVFLVVVAIGDMAYVSELYFRSVIPLPRGQSKVRQLLDDWSVRWSPLVPAYQGER